MLRLPATILVLVFSVPLIAGDPEPEIDRVIVYKQQHKLVLVYQGKDLRSYHVALGTEPLGPKQQQGDHRTPEGTYLLDFRNDHSQFYKAFHISYPNQDDIAVARKLGVSPGGDIMLHGLSKRDAWVGKFHVLHDWTDGCIAVSNDEMDEIWKLVRVGTPIEIKP